MDTIDIKFLHIDGSSHKVSLPLGSIDRDGDGSDIADWLGENSKYAYRTAADWKNFSKSVLRVVNERESN